jgi:hypothetical protein
LIDERHHGSACQASSQFELEQPVIAMIIILENVLVVSEYLNIISSQPAVDTEWIDEIVLIDFDTIQMLHTTLTRPLRYWLTNGMEINFTNSKTMCFARRNESQQSYNRQTTFADPAVRMSHHQNSQ